MTRPLTLLFAVEQCVNERFDVHGVIQDEELLRAAFVDARHVLTASALRVHVIGACGKEEILGTDWRAMTTRLPFCAALEVSLVGFLGLRSKRERWSAALYGTVPLDRSAPAPGARHGSTSVDPPGPVLRCLHGLYHELVKPGGGDSKGLDARVVPHVAYLPNADLGLYLDQWAPTIWKLIEGCVLTVVSSSGSSADEMETILQLLGAHVVMSTDSPFSPPQGAGVRRASRGDDDRLAVCVVMGGTDVFERLCFAANVFGGEARLPVLEDVLPGIIDELRSRGINTLYDVMPLQEGAWLGILRQYSR